VALTGSENQNPCRSLILLRNPPFPRFWPSFGGTGCLPGLQAANGIFAKTPIKHGVARRAARFEKSLPVTAGQCHPAGLLLMINLMAPRFYA
jgi:hypothetical protein